MSMVGHQRPGIDRCLQIDRQPLNPVDKIYSVLVIIYNLVALDSPDNDMVKGSRRIQTRFPWHLDLSELLISMQLPLCYLLYKL